ncbi:hypothetical protein P5F52_04485 [Clostridium perfringens]|uniref:Uncharacterized protein n=1 Tax=Clostridium perfringens (strain 13 / Type A) TaxID=195102 RepID=Q8XLE6_CLOPE|nr:hypothetical protein [Clostridium perfringens]MDK0745819.1 hypothetical protein [Clostridium perfringens]MDK0754933.1 hypothetical protein [Clostridium perfringens]MDK0755064.1 hypothetical protein [Clostridium perfringens]MDK0918048.1 hypothetical protein [Clostridium perfringens]STB59667.1 Uncharacterised protein [Clostridium perfringens]
MKTGTNTSIIINTRDSKHYRITEKKDRQKKSRAEICIECNNNEDGWCKKHKNWCGKVNYICLGVKDPYAKFNNGYNWNNNKSKKKCKKLKNKEYRKTFK